MGGAEAPEFAFPEEADDGVGAFRILRQQAVGHVQHLRQQCGVAAEIGDAVADVAGLPGAEQLALKLVVDADTDAILGAQAIGGGAEKRIDVIATAMAGAGRPSSP